MKHAASTWQDNPGDSVLGLTPREAITIRFQESSYGHSKYSICAYTGDGKKPGSLLFWKAGDDPGELFRNALAVMERK